MSQGNHPTTLQQRVEISERAQAGEHDAAIALSLGLKPCTVRKWRRRVQRQGRKGLTSPMGRPQGGILSHCGPTVPQVLRELRKTHPGWGPTTLLLEAARDSRVQGQPLPSRARVAAFLKAEDLTRRYERHTTLTQPAPTVVMAPHHEWEMDAQGVRYVGGVGKVSVINIGDPYSHLRVGSQACLAKSKADTPDYQLGLRRAFLRFGLPDGLSLDHDSAFFDNTSPSPYPSQLHLWALGLGITVRFIEVCRPTQHGFIERTHPIVDAQAMWGCEFKTAEQLQPRLDERLAFLNQEYPSRACGGQPPLVAYPAARHSGRPYRLEWESELLDLQRVYAYLAQQRWFRHVTAAGQFTLGTYRYGLGKAWGNQMIELRFDVSTPQFICRSADGQMIARCLAKGLTKANLMGELQLDQFPAYQFAFPWSAEACRLNLMFTEMTGTTL